MKRTLERIGIKDGTQANPEVLAVERINAEVEEYDDGTIADRIGRHEKWN
ncbi:Hypothetical predicted protein [Pelobates cultripes]|uniref:Uncharacterized protein n=1 Tax=Pelobates cultripes TaxID=61616 RepID=A0AAD1S968_PELCU|nr:Hypothetical predicted protein [Pelobates cultripes]